MQFIQRIRRRFQSPLTTLRGLQSATLYVMRHVGLVGRAECWATRTADGRDGVLLVIQTPQVVPAAAREEMQARADSDYAPLAPMTNLGTLSSN